MASFGEQFEASRVTHLGVRAIEARVREEIEEAWLEWERGELNAQSIRWRLEAIIRSAYRSAAALGVAHVSEQSGIPGWRPVGVFNTDYLQGLLADVRRNLRDFKASDHGPVARR